MQIGHRGEDLLPVPTHLVGTAEGTLRVRRRLADEVRIEYVHEGLEIVLVHRIAKASGELEPRLAPIYEAVRGAASADHGVRAVFEAIGTERRIGAGNVVGDLVAKGGALRDGLDVEAAADVLWVLIDAGLFHLLVHRRGWTAKRFEAWLAESMERELLA